MKLERIEREFTQAREKTQQNIADLKETYQETKEKYDRAKARVDQNLAKTVAGMNEDTAKTTARNSQTPPPPPMPSYSLYRPQEGASMLIAQPTEQQIIESIQKDMTGRRVNTKLH